MNTWTPDAAQYELGRPFPAEHLLRLIGESKTWNEKIPPQTRKRIFEPGSGTGRILLPLAKAYPDAIFIGADFYDDALSVCSSRARAEGISNIRLSNTELAALEWERSFDAVVHSSVLHSISEWESVLEKLIRSLNAEGFFVLIGDGGDIDTEALARFTSPGADERLKEFWSEYRSKWEELGLQHLEASQRGCKWDIDNVQISERLIAAGFQELECREVGWEQRFSIFDLLSIVENRCYSSMFTADQKKYAEIVAFLDGKFSGRGKEMTVSRHRAVAKFFALPAQTGAMTKSLG